MVLEERMPIGPPPKPPREVIPTEVGRTSSTIVIRFRNTYFSNKNGNVEKYVIVVTEDEEKNASGLELPTWSDVQSYDVWPPYQVIEPYNPFENGAVEDFEIGSDRSCATKIGSPGYCNGPLKAGTAYRVKIRAFTTSDQYSETEYSLPIVTEQDNTLLLVGILIPITFVLILLVFGLVLRRKCRHTCRRMHKGAHGDTTSLPESLIEIR